MIAIAYFTDVIDSNPNKTRTMRIGNPQSPAINLTLEDYINITNDKGLELYAVEYTRTVTKVATIITRTYLFANPSHKAKFLLRWA